MRSTDETFARLVRDLLARSHVPEADDGAVYTYSAACGVDRVLAGGKVARGVSSLYLQSLRIFRGRGYQEMAARLVSSMRDLVLGPQNEYVLLRAGAVALGGRAIVLPSAPQPHLPALVALLVRAGAAFLGDEAIKIDPILRRAHPLDLPLLIDEPDAELFADLALDPPRRRRDDERRQAMTPRRPATLAALGGALAGPTPIAWIVLPVFEPGAPTRVEPAGGAEVLFTMTQAGLNLHVWEDRALVFFRELMDSLPVSRLVVGSVPEAATALADAAATVVGEVSA